MAVGYTLQRLEIVFCAGGTVCFPNLYVRGTVLTLRALAGRKPLPRLFYLDRPLLTDSPCLDLWLFLDMLGKRASY